MKTRKLLIAVLLLLLPAVLVACGDDDDSSENNGNNESNESGVTLSQTFSANEAGMELSFKYPEGWVTSADSGQVALANSQATLDLIKTTPIESVELPADSYGLQIAILPAGEMPPDTTPAALLGMLTEGGAEGVTFGSVAEVGEGAKIPVTYAQSSGEVYLLQRGEFYLLVSAASPNYSNFEATTQAIVESLQSS